MRSWIRLVVSLAVLGTLVNCSDINATPSISTTSSGPTSPTGSTSEVKTSTVPEMVGLSLTTAERRAKQSGFEVVIEQKYSSKRAGTVLTIDPAAGSLLADGSSVSLTVAKSFPHVPNVVGMNIRAAKRALKSEGFDVEVKKQTSSQPKNTVIAQTPAAGTVSRIGRTVTLTVAIPAPSTGGGGGTSNCTPGYSPCLPLGPSDYDCAGGSGNGPAYTEPGVVYHVTGSDPYGLDADHDGLGCE
ncbi:MAG: PASTA domain-containing protein [Gemmatimonadota bacterium]|nr:PASTA domain-containing protein [Gemmatimonadota bacterium]